MDCNTRYFNLEFPRKVEYQKARSAELGQLDFRVGVPKKATPEMCIRWGQLACRCVTRRHIVGAWLASHLVTKDYLLANGVPKAVVLGAEELLSPDHLQKLKDEMTYFVGTDPLDAF